MARTSPGVSAKSKMSMFSAMRAGRTDLGIGEVPSSICQRKIIWAGVFPYFFAIAFDAADRRPRLVNDAVAVVGCAQRALVKERVQFHLVHGGNVPGSLDELVEIAGVEVAHTDSPNPA